MQYLISATLIICGISSAVQVTGIPLPFLKNRQIGAGILSVRGAGRGRLRGAQCSRCGAQPASNAPAFNCAPTAAAPLQVMGVSFATFSPANSTIKSMLKE